MIKSVKLHEEPKIIPMSAMNPYDIGFITEGTDKGKVVMRTASIDNFEVMDLSHPRNDGCWLLHDIDIRVRILGKGTKITLVVK